jgi:glucose-6-phosphate isomerase/transaldolase/glucose-6-phosphate isomerase
VTAFTLDLGPLAAAFDDCTSRLEASKFSDALWSRRLDVWTSDTSVQQKIATRLGWLGALDFIASQGDRLRGIAELVAKEHPTDIVLLGMGGSSLAPEVLRQVLGVAAGAPRFRMLDSTDPDAVRDAMAHAATSWFVLASKSGSTIEPNVMAAEALRRLRDAGIDGNSRFIAITDEGTVLHRRAVDDRMRDVFVNPSDIGGRYSALSFFGLVPAALMGADLDRLLAAARQMDGACRAARVSDNPGLTLGAFMAAGARSGRDKLTLLLPAKLAALGLWIEQLVAESTGKHGKGIVPIAGETGGEAPWSADRVAVAVTIGPDGPDAGRLAAARAAGTPILSVQMSDVYALGAEFLRWEIGTAAAGFLLEINPFDEPNVQQAKDATKALLESFNRQRQLPFGEPHGGVEGARLTLSQTALDALEGAPADAFLTLLRAGDYFGLLAYLPPDEPVFGEPLHAFRMGVGARAGVATMFGYGPRYLHSTGQLHKGGANNGVFLVVTADPAEDLPIPGEPFSFGVLEMAQALGDFQSLDRSGRRAMHVHLPRRDTALLQRVCDRLLNCIAPPRQ